MKNWEKREYRRIENAMLSGSNLIVAFEDGAVIEISIERLLPHGVPNRDWVEFSFDHNRIWGTVGSHPVEIPWYTIRSLTDPEFSSHLAARAEDQAKTIGTRLRNLRESKGLTSKQVAERAGISAQSLSRIEHGRHAVVFTTLQRILAAMGCPLRDIAQIDSQSEGAASASSIQGTIWNSAEPPTGPASTRKSPIKVFGNAESTTPSNTPGSNTPGISKSRAA